MLALPDIGIEVIFLIVAGIIAGLSRIVEWSQKLRRRSVEEQKQRAGRGGFAQAEPEARAEPPPRVRVETTGKKPELTDIIDEFLTSTPFPAARPGPAPPEPPRAPRGPSRLRLGGKPDAAVALPLAPAPAPAPRATEVSAGAGAYTIRKRIPARRRRLPVDLAQAIIAREVLGPPKAARYLRSIPRP